MGSSSHHPYPAPRTIGSRLRDLLGANWRTRFPEELLWPPDLFAITCGLVETCALYEHAVSPDSPKVAAIRPPDELAALADELAKCAEEGSSPTVGGRLRSYLDKRWSILWDCRSVELNKIAASPSCSHLVNALQDLMTLADLASAGFGVPALAGSGLTAEHLRLLDRVAIQLSDSGTLCRYVANRGFVVLPKQHVPRSGLTIRSFSHHLALVRAAEVTPVWTVRNMPDLGRANILVVPWPFEIRTLQFSPVDQIELPGPYGYFRYTAEAASLQLRRIGKRRSFDRWFSHLLAEASVNGPVHGVVFPETALLPDDFFTAARLTLGKGAFLVAGVQASEKSKAASKPEMSRNEVWMAFPPIIDDEAPLLLRQGKHHRWQLEQNQIEMYRLSGVLDPARRWWEYARIDGREVNFIALHGNLTLCCLICEDLARQEPVSQMIRSVGPNLVVALLSDGPQLTGRWAARYATVLADDPGCSVLAVTNLGMVERSRVPSGGRATKAVALWKDALNGTTEIELAEGASAILLSLYNRCETEWTADGRDDGGVAAYPLLAGVSQVYLREEVPKERSWR